MREEARRSAEDAHATCNAYYEELSMVQSKRTLVRW